MPVDLAEFKAAFARAATADQSRQNAIELIGRHLKIVQGLAHTDSLPELAGELHAAKQAIARIKGMKDPLVLSHLEPLENALKPVERLVAKMRQGDEKLPAGRAKVREGLAEGKLAGMLGDPATKREVLDWVGTLKSPDIDTVDELVAVFRTDAISDLKLLEAVLQHSKIERSEVEKMPSVMKLPAFRRTQIIDKYRETEQQKAQRRETEDKGKGERFLSSEYRIVNPLLAAFDALKVDPTVHQSPDYDYTPLQGKLLKEWRRIAVERGAGKDMVETWDFDKMKETYGVIRSMARVWDKYEMPEIPGGAVSRGDTGAHMFSAYPQLDPRKIPLADGEHAVSINLTWPGVMSTTVGDPKDHNFIQAKTFIWRFKVDPKHKGRSIGTINPSEQEVTFPVGTKIHVEKLVVRLVDKSLMSSEFGTNAEVIAIAKIQ